MIIQIICFIFDVIDIERQLNANKSWELVSKFISAFKRSDLDEFHKYSKEFLSLYDKQIDLMCKLKQTNMTRFISHARAYGKSEVDKQMFAYNAANMLML